MVIKIFISTVLLLSAACSREDSPLTDVSLKGEWVLQKAECYCFFGEDYDFSGHSLVFGTEPKEVLVVQGDDPYFITPAGTYPYTAQQGLLRLADQDYTYEIKGDSLVLTTVDDPRLADDELRLHYRRARD